MEEIYFIGKGEGTSGIYEKEDDSVQMEEIKARFEHALRIYNEKKEINEKLYEHELIIEELRNDLDKENKDMVKRIKDLRQEIAEAKQLFEEQAERALQHELMEQQRRQQRYNLIRIRKVEKEKQRLKEENEHLTAELEKLTKYHQEEKQQITTAEQEMKCQMKEIPKIFYEKDNEIKMLTSTGTQKMNMIEEKYKVMEDLKKENRELRKQMSDIEMEETDFMLPETQDSTEQEAPRTESCLSKFGVNILCVILIAIMVSCLDFYSVTNFIDSIWITVFERIEPYGERSYLVPPVYQLRTKLGILSFTI